MMRRVISWLWWVGVLGCHSPATGSGPAASGDAARAGASEVDRMVAAVAAERARCASGECAQACESGDGKACGLAAERFRDGKYGHAFDPAAALRYATRGCDSGDGLACTVLGEQSEDGIGTAWAPQAAINAYDKACRAGAGIGCVRLAVMYARGHGVDVDPQKIAAYFASARGALQAGCNGTDPRACLDAARVFYSEDDTRVLPKRRLLLQRACDRGVAGGCVDALIDRLRQGGRGVTEALRTLDELCTGGEASACSVLAWHFGHATTPGRFDVDAVARAVALTLRACELGERDDCVLAGQRYERGQGVARDDDAKRSYFDRACDRGAGRGCLYLAQDAFLTPGREDRVVRFAQRACELGESEGCAMMVRSQIEQGADADADRWALGGCRQRSWYSCNRLVARDLELPRVPAGWSRQLLQLACGEGQQPACRRLANLEQTEELVLRAMHEAVTKRDIATFAKLASSHVDLYGLWFDAPDCAKQFSGEVTLTAGAHSAFLACLALHGLRFDPQASADRSPALVYDPGVVLTVDVVDGAVARITGLQRQGSKTASIAPEVLARHLLAGTHAVEPDRAVREALAVSSDPVAAVRLYVCVDSTGKLEEARVLKSRHGNDGYARAVVAAAAAWRFKPFEVGGKAVPVCADDVFVYPAEHWRSAVFERSSIGLPANGSLDPRNVAPEVLEAVRIAGNKAIVPDPATKTAISFAGKTKLVGSFKLCITTKGEVAEVVRLKSTGFADYDQKIERELHTWRYSPFWIDGRPENVCTAVTFIYSQY